ncbi:MAG: IS701 family transposase [Acidimicrobiales bacterium]
MSRTTTRRLADWWSLVGCARGCFTTAGFALFETLLSGWVLAPGRRTITAMISAGDPEGQRAHDAYHRFVRCGRWSLDQLWRSLVVCMIRVLAPSGPVRLDIDDTLYKKVGRKVDGAGIFRDAVHSTSKKVVYALGLNLVVVTLRTDAPWGGCPIALPVGVRLHRKGGPTTIDQAAAICRQLSSWLPGRVFDICGDGAYATLIGRQLPNATVTSRMRRDAALYEAAPPRTRRRGRPRQRGARLETPEQMSKRLANAEFDTVEYDCRGTLVRALVWSTRVLWYAVDKRRLVTVVIVRDPDGICPDDFFVTDDEDAHDTEVVARYAGRWSIEVTFREVKQCLHGEDPQSWKNEGPERAAALSLWLYSAIWTWYITTIGSTRTWTARPWYPKKATPSFLDALAALRRTLWTERITPLSFNGRHHTKIIEGMLDVLANAA